MNVAALFIRATNNQLYSPVVIEGLEDTQVKQINDYLVNNGKEFVHSLFNTIKISKEYQTGFELRRATWDYGFESFDTFEEAFEKIKEWL